MKNLKSLLALTVAVQFSAGLQAATPSTPAAAPRPVAASPAKPEPATTRQELADIDFRLAAADDENQPGKFGYGAGYGAAAGGFGVSGYRSIGNRDSVPPVVIQFSNIDAAAAQQLDEDLSVMTHILDQALEKGLGEETPQSKMGIPLLYTGSGRSTRAMYLAGFGPLFMIKVNMPLLPPPSPTEEKPAQSAVDSEWETARREVLGGPKGGTIPISVTVPDVQFDPDQFEALKRTLVASLKNAANIRHLKPDEDVTIAVFGQPMPAAPPQNINLELRSAQDQNSDNAGTSAKPSSTSSSRSSKSSKRSSGKVSTAIISVDALQASNSTRGTVLTIRAKAGDITSLAQAKMSLEDFQKKVTTTAYSGSGYGVTSVNSWIQNGRGTR